MNDEIESLSIYEDYLAGAANFLCTFTKWEAILAVFSQWMFTAQAASITFSTPANCAADADIRGGGGAQVFAYTWGVGATVNGIPFAASTATAVVGTNLTLTGFTAANASAFIANAAPFSALSGSYSNILRGAVFNGTANTVGTATLNGLVPGHSYLIQLWVSDPRSGATTNRVEDVSSLGPVVRLDFNVGNAGGGVGQYTYATFLADGPTQDVTLDTSALILPDTGVPQINAIQLRDITGVWSGMTDGNWLDTDTTSQNFSGLSYTAVKAATTNVYFADKDAAGNAVATASITVGAGGVTGANAIFRNTSVAYTLNSADASGIHGAYGVTLDGSGLVAFNGANTYTGNTVLNAGTLVLGNAASVGGSAAVVLNGGTLDVAGLGSLSIGSGQGLRGSGTVRGSLVAAAGATLIPGDAGVIGLLNVTNNLVLNGQSLIFDLSSSPSAGDRIAVGNALTVNGTCTLSLNYLAGLLGGGTYTLMTFASKAGSGTFLLDTNYPGVTLNVTTTNVTLAVGAGSVSGVWTNLLGGTWGAATNWQGNIIPTNVDAVADFSTLDIAAARTVTINGTRTIGHLLFGDTVQNANWTLSTGTNVLAVSSGSPRIVVNGGQNTTISASLQGAQGFTKLGAGTLTLSGANRLTNAVSINGGTLILLAANPFGPTTNSAMVPLTLSNATLQITGAYLLTNNLVLPAGTTNNISQLPTSAGLYGSAGSPLSGGGVLNLNAGGNNPRLNGGANHSFTGTLVVAASGTGGLLTAFDEDPALPGFGYAGSSNAVFEFDGGSQHYMATTDWVGKGRVGATNYIGELRGSGATLYANNGRSGTTTLEIGGRNTNSTFSGAIYDNRQGPNPYTPAILRKMGTGKLTLAGACGYTGATEVRNGTLDVSGSIGNTPVTVYSGGTFQLDGTNGSASINVQDGGRFVVGTGANLGPVAISLNGLMDVTAFGGSFSLGSATLSGSGVVTGSVTLAATSINPGPIGAAGTLTITNGNFAANNGTLVFDLSNNPLTGNDLLVVNGNLDFTTPGVTISLNKLNAVLGGGTYVLAACSGTLTGSLGNLTLIGAGPLDQLQFNGNQLELVVSSAANLTWTGDGLGNSWDVGTSATWLNGATPATFANGDYVTFNDIGTANPVVNIPATVAPAIVTVSGSANYTFSGAGDITGGTTLIKNGTGALTVLSTNTFVGTIFLNSGTLAVGNANAKGQLAANITNSAALVYTTPLDQVVSNTITGPGSLTKLGSGVLAIAANNTLSGPTLVSAGTLSIGDGVSSAGALGSGKVTNYGTLMINRTSSLNMTNTIYSQGALVNVSTGSVVLAGVVSGAGVVTNAFGSGTLELAASNTYSGGTFIQGGTVMLRNFAGFGTGDVVMADTGGGVLQIAPTPSVTNVIPNNIRLPATNSAQFLVPDVSLTTIGSVRLTGVISGGVPGAATRIVNGGGLPIGNSRLALVLENPANSFSMNPEVYSGCLGFTSDAALGQVTNGITVRASTTAPLPDTLDFIGLRFDAENITLNPNRRINLVGDENINVQSFSGAIAGPVTGLGLTKRGVGTLTLSGPGSLTGTTTVSAGTLVVNSTWTCSYIEVLTNAVLNGTGTVNGIIRVNAGGLLALGTPATATLTVGNVNLVLLAGSTNLMKINAGNSSADRIAGIATATYGGTLVVTNLGGALAAGQSFQLFSAAGFGGTFAATNLPPLSSGLAWQWNSTNGTLSVAASVATNPTNLTFSVSGASLNLSWPADHLGWRLQVQTNTLLSSNWFTWPGSTGVTVVSVPIDPAISCVFFRMVYP